MNPSPPQNSEAPAERHSSTQRNASSRSSSHVIHMANNGTLQMEIQTITGWIRGLGRIVLLVWLIATAAFAPAIQAADDPLIIGVFPRRNAAETTNLFTPMANYL